MIKKSLSVVHNDDDYPVRSDALELTLPEIASDPDVDAINAQYRRISRAGRYLDLLMEREALQQHFRGGGGTPNRNEDLKLRLRKLEVMLAEYEDAAREDLSALAIESIATFDDLTARIFRDILPFDVREYPRKVALQHVRDLLRTAEGILFRRRDELIRTKSREMFERVRSQYNPILIRVFRALQELARAGDVETDFRRAFAQKGLVFPEDLGVPFTVANLLALAGTERALTARGEVVIYRKWLEDHGFLPETEPA